MLSDPSTPAVAALQAVVVAGASLTLGYLIVDVLARRSLDPPTKLGLALAAVCGYALALMVVHMATRGAVFSNPAAVRTVTGALALGLAGAKIVRAGKPTGEARSGLIVPVLLVLVSVVLWGPPLLEALPLPNKLDTKLHMGWATQILNGETVPSAPVTGDIPNYYPWLYHSFTAALAVFTPGGRALHALGPLQLVQVGGAVAALYALGVTVTGRRITGAAAAVFGALMGGFGYIWARAPDVVVNPRGRGGREALLYHGDLLFKRSYSFPFQNLAPPFPRDLAFTLLVAFLVLLAAGLKGRRRWMLVAAGATLGMVGLSGAEAFFVGAAVAAVVTVRPGACRRGEVAAAVFLPALAVYALWLAPLAANYLRFEGFVSITAIPPVSLPWSAIVVAWGVATPFALVALVRWARDAGSRARDRAVIALGVAAVTVLVTAFAIPQVLGEAFSTLGRPHRYWPLVHLAVVVAAAVGLTEVLTWVARAGRALAIAAGVAVGIAAVPSPLLAGLAITEKTLQRDVLTAALTGDPNNMLTVAAPSHRRCVAAVSEHDDFTVFSYTGHRLVYATWQKRTRNAARVRWKGMGDTVPDDAARAAANDVLVHGRGTRRSWNEAVARFGVDYVVVPAKSVESPVFAGMAHETATGQYGQTVYVIETGDC